MIITVHCVDGSRSFDVAGYETDEHNNLEVMGGAKADEPLALFNKEAWVAVIVGEEVDDA